MMICTTEHVLYSTEYNRTLVQMKTSTQLGQISPQLSSSHWELERFKDLEEGL